MMAGTSRWRPEELIQICTAQTLEKREGFPAVDLLIVDEAHCMRRETVEFIRSYPNVKVIGLSGSPFTKGLGAVYSHIESACTIDQLISGGWLVPLRVFVAKQIDMTGAKKVAGEWSQKESTHRGIQITGEVVSEWVKKTHEIYGGPRKTIVFCAGVAHGADLSQKFAAAGYNFVSISYKDDDLFKAQVLEDFSKPDTEINGIIATDILTKGFDQTDVMIGVSARPFSKSFSSHVQQLGRVMRIDGAKEFATWICHSGNFLRFRDQWEDLFVNGVEAMDDGAEKPKPEPSDKEKEAAKCPICGSLWPGNVDICPHCGHVRLRKNDVVAIAGEMLELAGAKKEKYSMEYKTAFYASLLGIAREKNYNPGWAYHKFIDKFGVGPSMKKPDPVSPSTEVKNWITSRNIAYAKRKKAA